VAGGEYASWTGHVIVCGLHGVGLSIVEELSLSGVPAVVVDDDPDLRQARTLMAWGVPHVPGSPRSPDTLAEAGLAGAAAVICALDTDLRTLETALLTRELRADVRVTVELGNPAVGRALPGIAISVLDVAGLSAPSIVEACLRSPQEITLAGQRFYATRTAAPRAASLRELYGSLTPVAVLPDVTGDGPAVFGFIRHRQSGYIGACVVVYRCTLSIATSIDFNLCYLIFKINGGNFPRMNAILKFQLVVLALPQTPGACHRFRSHLNTLTMTTRLSSTLEAVD